MSEISVRNTLIVPLFGASVDSTKSFDMDFKDIFSHPSKIISFVDPILIDLASLNSNKNAVPELKKPPKTIEVELPFPVVTVTIIPWGDDQIGKEILSDHLDLDSLPVDFDCFDFHSSWAIRPSQQLDSFVKITGIDSLRRAKSILLVESRVEVDEELSKHFIGGDIDTYNVAESFFSVFRVFVGGEPYPYKGFAVNNKKLLNDVKKWPIMEINEEVKAISNEAFSVIQSTIINFLMYRLDRSGCQAFNIFKASLGYYFLSSTLVDKKTSFMLCMMALESLCKENQNEPSSAAAARASKLISATKSDYKEILKWINNSDGSGFFQVRNGIAHGDVFDVDNKILLKLRNVIRHIFMEVGHNFFPVMDRKLNYYPQLHRHAEERFKKLKNQ